MSLFYIASKLFTYLALPPGIFIILFFFSSFYAKKFRLFFLFIACSFYALSNSYVADFLLSPLENPYKKTKSATNIDAVIVLGGGMVEGSPHIPLANGAYKRAILGLTLAKSKNIPLLFSGGGLAKYTEADAFEASLNELKTSLHVSLPKTSLKADTKTFGILVEKRSLDTFENAKFSKKLFNDASIKTPKIYLITSAFHMRRAVKIYKHFGFKVIPMATDFHISDKGKTFWDYFPNMTAFQNSYLALHEYIGFLSLSFRGI